MNHDQFLPGPAALFNGLASALFTFLLSNMPAGAVPGTPDSTVAGALSRHPFPLAQATATAEAALSQGMRLASNGSYAAAVQAFSDAIRLDPRSDRAYFGRGASLFGLGQWGDAVVDLTRSLELNPQNAEAYFARGLSLSRLALYPAAISDFDRALKINSQHAKAVFHRGNAKVQTQDLPGALMDYTRAKMIDPRFADAYFNRAVVVIKLSTTNKKVAIKDLETAAEIYRSEGNAEGLERVRNTMQAIQSIGQ
ncbi:MAG: tetratricopeptide repeat protein [Cyanobacteriota bacterium]